MSHPTEDSSLKSVVTRSAARLGYWASLLEAVLAGTAFAIGLTTPPRSGPFCSGLCIFYPYTDAAQFVPQDYLWMYPAIVLTPLFVVMMGCIHYTVPVGKRLFSLIGICFASICAAIITMDYFFQVDGVQPSILKGEADGLALFSQYNPHGVFIVLEDLGYLMLAAAFLFAGLAIPRARKLGTSIRWTFLVSAFLAFAFYLGMSWHFGTDLGVRFEFAVITIDWVTLIVAGLLLSVFFRRAASDGAF